MIINSFRGAYFFLSNFSPAEVYLNFPLVVIPNEIHPYQQKYRTVEHAFQAAKFSDVKLRDTIRSCKTPNLAKKIAHGHKHLWRSDWDQVRLQVMAELLHQKFNQEPLRSQLLATGDASLVEGNWWHDTFWGICNGYGDNWLGQLLMQLREYLRCQR